MDLAAIKGKPVAGELIDQSGITRMIPLSGSGIETNSLIGKSTVQSALIPKLTHRDVKSCLYKSVELPA